MKLLIERPAYDKIRAFTDLCPTEISGLGKVEVKDGDFVVSDVAIFEQEVSGAHSTIEPTALAKFQSERVKAGETMKPWCFWWHSHADMGVFFSGTDTSTIESSTEFPFLVSLVVNKKRESKARLDVYYPVHLFIELDVEVLETANEAVNKECQKEIDKKVSKPKWTGGGYYGKGGGYWGGKKTGFQDWDKKGDGGIQPRKGKRSAIQPPYSGLLDVPERHISSVDYWEAEEEYREHKIALLKRIKKMSKKGRRAEVERLQVELLEHITWGKSMGYDIVREAEVPLITSGK